jgi:hypothetical protein
MTNVLEEALALTNGDRRADYGSAYDDAVRFAQMASAATGLKVEPQHFAVMMICAKLSREYNKHKHDNLVDIAGYARVLEMIWEDIET